MIDEADSTFTDAVWDYYHARGRHDLPWRQSEPNGSFDPYKIMVSELMLQQTQVARVIPKYQEFLSLFPSAEVLAAAPLGDVLRAWSGLGYNRRAKFLWLATRQISENFPETLTELQTLPGIGPGTAGAIAAYAFNQPVAFIETNIRTVYIHHFFNDQEQVADRAILELVAATLNREHPREWYWALMDYGSYLKQTVGNRNVQSKSYAKQSKFEGSSRQVRGQVLRALGNEPANLAELRKLINDERLVLVLSELVTENLIHKQGRHYHL